MSNIEFDTPANRIISQFTPKNKFRIDTSLPDLSFLRQLSVQGRLRYFVGGNNTITPNEGETLFIYKVIISNPSNAAVMTFTLLNDGQTRLTVTLAPVFTANAGTSTSAMDIPIFDSLVGDGIKAITTTGGGNVTILGWVENTSRIRDITA